MGDDMIPNLDIDLLKTFLAVADTGSFTRAAEEVNKTQSAVSMQMKRLEELLGRPLFSRDGRTIRFSVDGERLIEYARRMVSMNDEAVAAFTTPEISGSVRLGTPDDYADHLLPEILARFWRTHPLVTVDVECLDSSRLSERTRRGELDLSLVTFGCDVFSDEPVRREPLVWVASAKHNVHLLDVLPLASPECEWRRAVLKALDSHDRRYRIAYASNNSNAITAAVLTGLAVGAMPELCVRPGMRILTERDGFPPLGTFDIGLVRRPGKSKPAVDALARHIAESLASQPHQLVAAE
jgi:DNA-binding transcriptional LysR family regulator